MGSLRGVKMLFVLEVTVGPERAGVKKCAGFEAYRCHTNRLDPVCVSHYESVPTPLISRMVASGEPAGCRGPVDQCGVLKSEVTDFRVNSTGR